MNASFVSEGVCADDGFVGSDAGAGDLREQLAGRKYFRKTDAGGNSEMRLADGECYGEFFERSVSGAFADAVDGAFDLARAGSDRGERICDGEAEIVVAMRAERDVFVIAQDVRELL